MALSIPAKLGLCALLLALALVPRTRFYRLLQLVVFLPEWTSIVLVGLLGWILYLLLRSERHQSPSYTRRYGLPTLAFTTSSAWSAVLTKTQWEGSSSSGRASCLSGSERLNSRLDSVLRLIRISFILPWYNRISPSTSFPNAIDDLIYQALREVVSRFDQADWSHILVSKIIPTITDHLRHYRSIEHLSSSDVSPDAALPLPLPANSHPALMQQAQVSAKTPLAPVEAHFRSVLERVAHGILPEKDRSEVVTTVIREVLLGSVLLPVFEMLCDSDFWNRQLDEKGGRYLHEQKQVNKFLSVLSSLPDPASDSRQSSPLQSRSLPPMTSITASSSTRQFESFLKSIPKVKTLGEARRLRADIDREQRMAKTALEKYLHAESKDVESQAKKARKYVKRLERARLEVDARISALSRSPGKSSHLPAKQAPSSLSVTSASSVDLYGVLSDPSSLAYWLEYMERRFRTRLVQFWLTVEGFKDPLEGIGQNASADGTLISSDHAATQSADTILGDLTFLHQTYFVQPDQLLNIPSRHIGTISALIDDPLALADVRKAKQAMFLCQQAVYEQMQEEDWPGFKKSELFVKACSDLSRVMMAPKSPAGSPELSTTTSVPAPLPPRQPQRLHTSPLPMRRTMDPRAPSSPKPAAPTLVGGYFTPIASSLATGISVAPPDFHRRVSDVRPVIPRKHSNSEGDVYSPKLSLPPTPSMPTRRSSQLDFLISNKTEDMQQDRSRLFDEEDEDETVHEEDDNCLQIQRMEAIQAALNEIIASDDVGASQVIEPRSTTPDVEAGSAQSLSSSMIMVRRDDSTEPLGKLLSRSVEDLRDSHSKRPTLSSTPSSKNPSKPREKSRSSGTVESDKRDKHLFDDDVMPRAEPGQEQDEGTGSFFQSVLPENLDIGREIARLQDKLEELVKQEHLLDGFIRQAELTGNAAELAILNRSHTSVRREQRTAIFQKAQLEQQEDETRIVPGRTSIAITSAVITTADDDGGKQVVRYNIEIKQNEDDRAGTCMVSRRYNDFWELDRNLREWAIVKGEAGTMKVIEELPPKKLVPNLSAGFIESRRLGLQRYLQSVTLCQVLCESPSLRSFLSRSVLYSSPSLGNNSASNLAPHSIVKSLYKTMATSLDENLLGPNMLDLMYSTLNRQLIDLGGMMGLRSEEIAGLGTTFLPQALKAGWSRELSDSATAGSGGTSAIAPMGGESGSGSFTAPICDLFIEVFDLKENNWLRRQAIVVILQQFLGSTIERKVKDTLKAATSAESIENSLTGFQDMMWPEGEWRAPSDPRTDIEKAETRQRASRKLGLLIPDVAANMIGRGNARRAARRVFGALQDKRLNQQLVLCVFDEILGALFPPSKS